MSDTRAENPRTELTKKKVNKSDIKMIKCYECNNLSLNSNSHHHIQIKQNWMRFNCFKATEPIRGHRLLFTTKPHFTDFAEFLVSIILE